MVRAAPNYSTVDCEIHTHSSNGPSFLPFFPKLERWGRLMSYLLSTGWLGIVSLSLCHAKRTLSPLDHPGALVG